MLGAAELRPRAAGTKSSLAEQAEARGDTLQGLLTRGDPESRGQETSCSSFPSFLPLCLPPFLPSTFLPSATLLCPLYRSVQGFIPDYCINRHREHYDSIEIHTALANA